MGKAEFWWGAVLGGGATYFWLRYKSGMKTGKR